MSSPISRARFEWMDYDSREIRLYTGTQGQVLQACNQNRDFICAPPFGILKYLGGNGQILQPGCRSRLWTDTSLRIMEAVELNPDIYLGLNDVNQLTGLNYRHPNSFLKTLQGIFKKLQAAWPGPHLIEVTKGPKVRWVAKHTWLWVKLLAPNSRPPSTPDADGRNPDKTE